RRGVADEDHVDAGVLREAGPGSVVGGHHHDPLAAFFHLRELRQRQLSFRDAHLSPFSVRPSQAEAWHGTSTTTLSMRRVPPTRTAAARTLGSKSASSK